MIFLLTYDRQHGKLLDTTQYLDGEIKRANGERLELEIEHATNPDVEIIILRSASLEELRRTHARYFKTLNELQRF